MFLCKGLMKSFKSQKVIFDATFSMKKGEIAFLVGKSGEGKSTLFRMIAGLEPIDGGDIFLNGIKPVCSDVGMVFQGLHLFEHLTAQENIALALTLVDNIHAVKAKEIALDLLDSFQLKEKADMYPRFLSGGQKQRVAILRAIARNPKLLCLDEPTSALDEENKELVIQMIKKLAVEGMMIIIITHDPQLPIALKGFVYEIERGIISPSSSF